MGTVQATQSWPHHSLAWLLLASAVMTWLARREPVLTTTLRSLNKWPCLAQHRVESVFMLMEYRFLNDPILTNRNSSSRDNSIIIIKVLIGIIVYDLDVELNILICAVAF